MNKGIWCVVKDKFGRSLYIGKVIMEGGGITKVSKSDLSHRREDFEYIDSFLVKRFHRIDDAIECFAKNASYTISYNAVQDMIKKNFPFSYSNSTRINSNVNYERVAE